MMFGSVEFTKIVEKRGNCIRLIPDRRMAKSGLFGPLRSIGGMISPADPSTKA